MKQPQKDKSIAWFKLAEFIARGEKERALGIYKLLTLSLNDQAFIHKLEGDLLLAFNDITAIESYVQAAKLYSKNHNNIIAAAIYEHLLTLKPNTIHFLRYLTDLYKELNDEQKIINTLQRLIHACIQHDQLDYAQEIIQESEGHTPAYALAALERLIITSIHTKQAASLSTLLNLYFSKKLTSDMQKFLTKLKVLDEQCHQQALNILMNHEIL